MATRIQKVMVQPIQLVFKYLKDGRRISIWLYDNKNMRIEGTLRGFDEYMNLVLDDAEEVSVRKGTRRSVGRIMLKGDNIAVMQQLGQEVDQQQHQ